MEFNIPRWIEGTPVVIKKYAVGDYRRIGRIVGMDCSKMPIVYSVETGYSASSGSYLESELTDIFEKSI